MTVFDWLRPSAAAAARQRGALAHVPMHLPPADQPECDPPAVDTCHLCPAYAVALLARVVFGRHSQWVTYEAATVQVRGACRHHADELLADEGSPWWEMMSRDRGV